jgi:DNA-binding IscR family transcriptional regulator
MRAASAISLAEIVEAVEGPIAMTNCADELHNHCALDARCRVKPHLLAVNGAFRGALQGVSLASLAEAKA